MRTFYTAAGSAGATTPWVVIDRKLASFGVGIGVVLSEDANLTYTVQHTFDPFGPDWELPVSLVRAAGVVTATFSYQHGLTTTDTLLVRASGSSQMDSQPYARQIGPPWPLNVGQPLPFAVASTPSNTTITYAVANAGPAADNGVTMAQIIRTFNNATLAAQTTKGNTNYVFPVSAVRLVLTAWTAGFAQLEVLQGDGF